MIVHAQGNQGWTPLDHKLLKELQQSVQLYGPHANFTKAVLDNIGTNGLVPEGWRNLAKAVLGGGYFLLWSTAYRELSRAQAHANTRNGQPAWNKYNDEEAQAGCPNEVLMQVRELAQRALKAIPRNRLG